MKFGQVVVLSLSSSVAATNLLASRSSQSLAVKSESKPTDDVLYGDTACPCIGFDNIEGETTVIFEGGEVVGIADPSNAPSPASVWSPMGAPSPASMALAPSPAGASDVELKRSSSIRVAFPADLGARCEAWDDDHHPECHGKNKPAWCKEQWCFVDACNCNIPVLPKLTSYAPDARYRGKPIFFSYATCGGEDTFSKVLPEVGSPGCRCIGFDNIPGSTDIRIGKQVVSYPAEIGGTCRSWDADLHPECKKGEPESWCQHKWCYVDPCSCDLPEVPKVTMYLPEASFTGKSLYYSYETCGSPDTFTKKWNLEACVNQQDKERCEVLKKEGGHNKCAWTGTRCLGAELVTHPLCTGVVDAIKEGEAHAAPKSGSVVSADSTVLALAATTLALAVF